MHRTSLCPHACGHANAWYVFAIDRYLAHAKPGQYGDEEQREFALQLRPAESRVAHAPGALALAAALAPGDAVRLDWVHEYVTEGGSKFPERRVTRLERQG